MMQSAKSPARLWRRIMQVALGGLLVAFAGLYGLAQVALSDLDRIVGQGPGAVEQATQPLSVPKDWALFLTAQVLPLRQPGAAALVPGKVVQDCPDCPELVEIPAGFYLMGSPLFESGRYQQFFGRFPIYRQFRFLDREGPRRLVHIARPFGLTRYELTFAQWDAAQDDPAWQAITGRPARKPLSGIKDRAIRAVTNVDRIDAEAYAKWLSHKTGHAYRVPTEAEWEYAARAGTTSAYPWGNDIGLDNATCVGCGDKWSAVSVGPVGLYPPNGYGLYDMNGNAWEWVQDCFEFYHPASTADGSAYVYPNCELGVFKGGTAITTAWQSRSAMRVGPHPYNNAPGSTIRLLREF